MPVNLQVAAAVAAVIALATAVFGSRGRWLIPAIAAVVLLLADELSWFAPPRNHVTEAEIPTQPSGEGGSRRASEPLPGEWTATYRVTGGIAGLDRSLTVTRAGVLIAEEHRFGQRAAEAATPALMERLNTFLQTARPAPPEPESPIRDGLNVWLTLSTNGRERELELSREMAAVLDDALTRTLRDALLGSWEQSEWKLCRPVPSLTAAEMEPQIDRLRLAADGRFSVRWATGSPLIEYHGQYRADPFSGTIGFELESPPLARDFAGAGRVRIDMDRLVLENVWFGTVQAVTKPDICELAFRRILDQVP